MFDEMFETKSDDIDEISNMILEDLTKIQNAQGKNAKVEILKDINTYTFRAFVLYLDPFQTFGVSKLKGKPSGTGIEWETVFRLLSEKKGRELDKISDRMNQLQFDLVNGIFNGFQKWRLGVKGGSFLKVYPDAYQTFKVQLCAPWNPEEFEEGSYAQIKYDGTRCVAAVNDDGEVFFLSRNGKPVENVNPLIEEELKKFPGHIFDAETDADVHFQKISGITKKKSGSDVKLTLKIFDTMTYDEFMARKCDRDYETRYEELNEKLKDSPLKDLIAEHEKVETIEQAEEFYAKARAAKREGAIVKKAKSLYVFDRNDDWMKVKPLETIEARIIEVIEGSKGSKYEGMMGAIRVMDGTGAISRVGSGFDDPLRKWFWENKEEIEEDQSIAEIKFMERTESGVFRHSRFKCLRTDKDDLNPGL
ncbi:putative ATP-dependent DNA ligase [Sinorhizobium phage phiM9]|uniref:DNA ligase n=1 Tax=Sinorhizobium phage phiM9 TaxID=1636182 RepID=A0A0F6R7Q7_9CAUD|nr:putative ATP-dependent DNA ligase [Sinorhizobium phage phiM9]AKE44853.1 putative ATP-dependent DNA ligase [Sinorhizobium phage phiM9]